jgi:hypothetical protein
MSDQYRVIGPDGREYGPVPLETLVEWAEAGRVVPATPVRRGEEPPVAAGSLLELTGRFASGAGVPPPLAAPPFPGAARIPPEFRAWGFIEQAWGIVKVDWFPFAAMFFLVAAINCVPYVGWVVSFFIEGALLVGIWRAVLGRIDGRPVTVGMMFEGFDRFLDAFLALFFVGVLTLIGFGLLIVPGIILTIVWAFTMPIVAETKMGFWRAMDASVALTKGYRMEIFLLWLASILILLLGLLCCCVGVFVAMPVCVTAFGLAYRFLQARQRAAAG